MECKEIEKWIPLFLEDGLDTEDLRTFMDHVTGCDSCMEELSIQFLVTEGMSRLNTGNVFDLQNELNIRLENARRHLQMRENMRWLLFALEGLVAVEMAAAILLFALLL